jgi:hypothetical protein
VIFAIDITLDIFHIGSCLSLLDDFQRITGNAPWKWEKEQQQAFEEL